MADQTDNFQSNYAYATTFDEAQSSGKALAEKIQRSKKSFEITMPGNLDMIAGANLTLSAFPSGVNGAYKIIAVTHSISRNGWTTSVSGEAATA